MVKLIFLIFSYKNPHKYKIILNLYKSHFEYLYLIELLIFPSINIVTLNNKENFKLVLSCSASNPRVYLANNYKKENPINAPMFCMLFRKYIQGGNIVNISQIGFERIIKISVESFDELKEKTTKDIIIEIMGRHSNIILTHSLDNKIIDSAKRIPPSVSRVRQILPGE